MKRIVDDVLVLTWMGWVSVISWYYSTRWWS